jgi:hypothetical protein
VVAAALKEIAKQNPAEPKPECCVQKGFDWDEALLFPPDTHWSNGSIPVFWNGTILRVAPTVEKALVDTGRGE